MSALSGVRLIRDASSSIPLQARVQQQAAQWHRQRTHAVFSAWRRQIILANQKEAAIRDDCNSEEARYALTGWRLQARYVGHADDVVLFRRCQLVVVAMMMIMIMMMMMF